MSTTTKSNRRANLTEYEVIGSPGASHPAARHVATTEYESPNGLDLNNTEPDQESSNAESELAGAEGDTELGVTGPQAVATTR